MKTINISMPNSMYEDMKKYVATHHYASISEFVRDAIRRILYPNITDKSSSLMLEVKKYNKRKR